MSVAPPSTVEHRPPPDRASLRRQARSWLLAAGLLAVPSVILMALSVAQYMSWAGVQRDGVRTPADVVGASFYAKASDRIRVAFATADGKLVEASIPVDDVSRYSQGSTVVVAYDPGNPRRARTLEDWNPTYVWTGLVAAALGLVALAILRRARRWPRRLWRIATGTTPRRRMVVTGATVPGRVDAPWAILEEGGEPMLAFRLADESDVPALPTEVEVVGDVRRRGVAVAFMPDRVIWPAGKLRRLPKRILPRQPAPEAKAEVPADLPGTRGDLPPLPPEFFWARPRPTPFLLRLAVVAPVTLALTAPFVLPEVIEAHRRECPSPPAHATGDVRPVPADGLPALLPATLGGFTLTEEKVMRLDSFANPPTQVALVEAGFLYGFERDFVAEDTRVKIEVFQFDAERGPARYEASRLSTLCAAPHRRLPVPGGSGVSGAVIGEDASELVRLTFIRGSRDYIVNVEGRAVAGHAEVLRQMMALAR